MNIERKNQIKDKFWGSCPSVGEVYTNQEIVKMYEDIQSIAKECAFEKNHAEALRDKDLKNHFQMLAEEHELDQTEVFSRFIKKFKELGYIIATYKKGLNGEKLARKSLKLVSLDHNVRILYNIQLEDEDLQAEYDAIVITSYGIFVIEVKNWYKEMIIDEYGRLSQINTDIVYDIPGKMCTKKALLKECLGDLLPDEYHSIILFPEEKATCVDNYKKIPISFGSGVSSIIQDYNHGNVLSKESIDDIAAKIEKSHKEQYSTSPVNCEQLVDDFATLMVMIEEEITESKATATENEEIGESSFSFDSQTSLHDDTESVISDNDETESENDIIHYKGMSHFKPSLALTFTGLIITGYVMKKIFS